MREWDRARGLISKGAGRGRRHAGKLAEKRKEAERRDGLMGEARPEGERNQVAPGLA